MSELASTTPWKAILDWSMNKPDWMRDALRRIVVNGTLSDVDRNELLAFFLVENKLSPMQSGIATPSPLEQSHLPVAPAESAGAISLVSLSDVTNVNRLAPDQRLQFGPSPGLTVIYGMNGTGKSGYSRILKRACRTRGTAGPVLSNVLAEGGAGTPAAKILYSQAGQELRFDWKEGGADSPALRNIFVFDADSAAHYVQDEGGTAFMPAGLDVLPKLANVMVWLKAQLEGREKAAQESLRLATISVPRELIDQAPIQAVLSSAEPAARAEVTKAQALSSDDLTELASWKQLLQNDPLTLAGAQDGKAVRAEALANALESAKSLLTSEKAVEIRETHRAITDGREMVSSLAEEMSSTDDLKGTGESVWLTMWKAARLFAEAAFAPMQSQDAASDPSCPLCQQPLSPDAKERLKRFDRFASDKAQSIVSQREAELKAIHQSLEALSAKHHTASLNSALISSADALSAPIYSRCKALVDQLLTRQAYFLKLVASPNLDEGLNTSPHFDSDLLAELRALVKKLRDDAEAARKSEDPVEREKVRQKALQRESLRWLSENSKLASAIIQQRQELILIKDTLKNLNTRPVSDFSGTLMEETVTTAFKAGFRYELNQLGLDHLSVSIGTTGPRAESKYSLQLDRSSDDGKTTKVKERLQRVLSEGESKGVALAAAFAEIGISGNMSALIFDDPVTSLDQRYQERIARRLLEESARRQVIVFSHDLPFALMLVDKNELASSSPTPTERTIDRRLNDFGVVVEAGPGEKLKDRLKRLRESALSLRSFRQSALEDEYRGKFRDACSLLRETWEKAVEELLLSKVVMRFRDSVQIQQLGSEVARNTAEDYRAVVDAHNWASAWISAHHHSPKSKGTLVEPCEFERKVEELATWVKDLSKRRDKDRRDRQATG